MSPDRVPQLRGVSRKIYRELRRELGAPSLSRNELSLIAQAEDGLAFLQDWKFYLQNMATLSKQYHGLYIAIWDSKVIITAKNPIGLRLGLGYGVAPESLLFSIYVNQENPNQHPRVRTFRTLMV